MATKPANTLFATAASHFADMAKRAKEGRAIMADADAQTEANGFEANIRVTEYLDLTFDDLADWNPLTSNAANDAVNVLHHYYSPGSSPDTRKVYANALHLAVCAVPEEKAKAARNGGDNADPKNPQYKAVPVRKLSTTGAMAGHFAGTSSDAAAALAKAQQEAHAAGNAVAADLYARAIKCASDMRKGEYSAIRRMAADLNLLQVRARRWRSILYLNPIREKLLAYEKSNPVTPIGRVWLPACDLVQSVHKDYWKDTGEAFIPDAAALQTRIDAELNKFLGIKGDVEVARAAAEAKEAENPTAALIDAIKKALTAAKAADKRVTMGLSYAIETALRSPVTAAMLQDQHGIDVNTVLAGGAAGKGATKPTGNVPPPPAPEPKPARQQAAPAPTPAAPAPNAAKPQGRKPVATPAATSSAAAQSALNKIAAKAGGAATK